MENTEDDIVLIIGKMKDGRQVFLKRLVGRTALETTFDVREAKGFDTENTAMLYSRIFVDERIFDVRIFDNVKIHLN